MTRRWHIESAPTILQLNEIAGALASGAVVLMPTDTIYGLHAVAANEAAVARIAELKGRDEQQKPFIVLASSVEQLPELGISATPEVLAALASIWPAPLTAVLPRGGSTLAVRIPDVEWLRGLIARTGPLVSTSANRSGEPAVEHPSALARDLHDALDVVDGGVRGGEPSAILDLTGDEPRFIRERDLFFTQKVWKTLRKSL
ncbi:MAG TPA: L-threonylcarbamoyladenylate synthase [Thermoanaerobaculia bacterium]|jgi:tRNA threonylcarbamoyl adenosine modification protein (Sua5/YciO/YrdC/YwlC family)|nr:L-threonylcarbamoyladenylate synthase [Thermoanaerobaculia bacterium]